MDLAGTHEVVFKVQLEDYQSACVGLDVPVVASITAVKASTTPLMKSESPCLLVRYLPRR